MGTPSEASRMLDLHLIDLLKIWILVGGLEQFLFFHILGMEIPTDFHIFQRGGSTTNQNLYFSNPVFGESTGGI